jgi:hypothetical protein
VGARRIAAAANIIDVARNCEISQTVDYPELLPEVGCFGLDTKKPEVEGSG